MRHVCWWVGTANRKFIGVLKSCKILNDNFIIIYDDLAKTYWLFKELSWKILFILRRIYNKYFYSINKFNIFIFGLIFYIRKKKKLCTVDHLAHPSRPIWLFIA